MGLCRVIAQNGGILSLNSSVLTKTPRDCTALPASKTVNELERILVTTSDVDYSIPFRVPLELCVGGFCMMYSPGYWRPRIPCLRQIEDERPGQGNPNLCLFLEHQLLRLLPHIHKSKSLNLTDKSRSDFAIAR
jgi:hypothetical protein